MSIVYTAQSSVELEQHAFLPTEGAMKNSQSGGVGGQKGHVDCQAPCSDGLLHQGCGIFQARVLEWGVIAFSRIYVYV